MHTKTPTHHTGYLIMRGKKNCHIPWAHRPFAMEQLSLAQYCQTYSNLMFKLFSIPHIHSHTSTWTYMIRVFSNLALLFSFSLLYPFVHELLFHAFAFRLKSRANSFPFSLMHVCLCVCEYMREREREMSQARSDPLFPSRSFFQQWAHVRIAKPPLSVSVSLCLFLTSRENRKYTHSLRSVGNNSSFEEPSNY